MITDRNEMSNLYREPSIDTSYQVSVHLAQRFQRRRFFLICQSETRIVCGGHVCQWIETKMSNLYRGPSIDASYQVSVHLAKWFQKRRFFSTNQKQELPVAAIFVNESGRYDQSLYRTFHRCFLLSFGSFGQAVSEPFILHNNCACFRCRDRKRQTRDEHLGKG